MPQMWESEARKAAKRRQKRWDALTLSLIGATVLYILIILFLYFPVVLRAF